MSIIGDIISVAKEIRGYKERFTDAKQERRADIGNYFSSISACLEGTYESLKKDEIPHMRCAEMETYANLLPVTLGEDIGKDKAEELSNRLLRSHEVELLWSEFNSDPEAKKELPKIAEAAGVFAALATSVKAGLDM